jgi:hypothetical protein
VRFLLGAGLHAAIVGLGRSEILGEVLRTFHDGLEGLEMFFAELQHKSGRTKIGRFPSAGTGDT